MSGHPQQGAQYDEGYGHQPGNTESYYQDEHGGQQYYDNNAGYEQGHGGHQQQGGEGYYDESWVGLGEFFS